MSPDPHLGLPTPVSRFIGRADQVTELDALLRQPGLVTLHGAPGVGKSRLAIEVARLTTPSRAVTWVDLTPLPQSDLVVQAVASALGVHERHGRSLLDGVVSALRCGNRVLVLDNCEHVIAGVRILTKTLVEASPSLTILATSRQCFGLDGERCWLTTPLPLVESEALFYARASEGTNGFDVDDDAAAAVTRVCTLLEGIPLAIELAAGRAAILPLTELAVSLTRNPLPVLGGGNRCSTGRHGTVRAALDWSYRSLDDDEATLLRRLSVFRGGFTRHTARSVCSSTPLNARRTTRALRSLIDKSLVVTRRRRRSIRYDLLATVRAYAAERCSTAESAAAEASHARWCADLAEATEPELTGTDQLAALATVDAEHGNLAAAFDWAIEHSPEDALRIAASMTVWWKVRTRPTEGRLWLGAAIAQSREASPRLRARALWGLGLLNHTLRDEQAARAAIDQSVRLARRANDDSVQARALFVRSLGAALPMPSVLRMLSRSILLAQRANDSWCEVQATARAAAVARACCRPEARSLAQRAVALAQASGDLQGLVASLTNQGYAAARDACPAGAEALTRAGLAAAKALGDQAGVATAMLNLGDIAFWQGRIDVAHEMTAAALDLAKSHGVTSVAGTALIGLGYVQVAENDLDGATESLTTARVLAGGTDQSTVLRGLGLVAVKRGEFVEAQRLLDESLRATSVGDLSNRAAGLSGLGTVARRIGDDERALALRRRALSLWWKLDDDLQIASALERVGEQLLRTGQFRAGLKSLGTARALSAPFPQRPPCEVRMTPEGEQRLRSEVDADEMATLYDQGISTPRDEAVKAALKTHGARSTGKTGPLALTGGEQEVARLVAAGYSNDEIARHLALSAYTVENQRRAVNKKLRVTSRTGLIRALAGEDH